MWHWCSMHILRWLHAWLLQWCPPYSCLLVHNQSTSCHQYYCWMPKHWQGSGMQVVMALGSLVDQWSGMAHAVYRFLKKEIDMSLGLDGIKSDECLDFNMLFYQLPLSLGFLSFPRSYAQGLCRSGKYPSRKAIQNASVFAIKCFAKANAINEALSLGAMVCICMWMGFPRVLQLQCLSLIVEHQFLNDSIQSDLWFLLSNPKVANSISAFAVNVK